MPKAALALPSAVLLGLGDGTKSFTGDASINIVELANSRRTREAVAMERIPSMQNKTVSELMIEENNRHTGFMQNELIDPAARQPFEKLILPVTY